MMRTKKLFSLLLAAALCCTTLFAGCGGDESSEPAPEGVNTENAQAEAGTEKMADVQELVTAYNSDPTTMDPAFSNTVPDQRAQAPVYEGLTRRILTESGALEDAPAAAESWDVNEDETVYTFHLRKDAKWSDGTPVTAQDFEYSWRRVFDPATASPQAWLLQSIIKNGDACMAGEKTMDELGIKVIDDYTFEVTLEKPNVTFLTLSGYNFVRPVKKDLIEQYGSTYGSSVDKTVGNGPFVLTEWNPGSNVSYVPNEHYWDAENVKLTKLTTKIIQETSTLAQALIANEVDIAAMNNPDWNDMVDQTGYYDAIVQPKMEMEYLGFNCEDPILKNPKIRLAISLAWDRDKYNNDINNGNSYPAYCMTPDISTVGDKLFSEWVGEDRYIIKKLHEKYPDPKALLLEGMAEEGLGDDPSKIEVHFYTRGVSEYCKKSAEWQKQEIEQTLGIKFLIEMTEWNILYDLVDAGTFQIAELGWNADVGLEPNEFLDLFEYSEGYYGKDKLRWTGEKAEEYSKLVFQVREETDDAKKAQLYLQMEQILNEESPVSVMYATMGRTLVGKYVKGYMVHPLLMNDYAHVYITER